MATPTPENVQLVIDTQGKFGVIAGRAMEIHNLLREVIAGIRQDKEPNLNANVDWDEKVALYVGTYNTKVVELKALVDAI